MADSTDPQLMAPMQRAFARQDRHVCGGRYVLDFEVTQAQLQRAVDAFCERHPILRGRIADGGKRWFVGERVRVTRGHPSGQEEQTAWRVSMAEDGVWFYFDHTLIDGWANFLAANAVLDHLATGAALPEYPMTARYPRMSPAAVRPLPRAAAGVCGVGVSVSLPLTGEYRRRAKRAGVRGMEQLAEAAVGAFGGQYPAITSQFIPGVVQGLCHQSMFAMWGLVGGEFSQLVDYPTFTRGLLSETAQSIPHLAVAVFPAGRAPYVWVETFHDFHPNQMARVLISGRTGVDGAEEHYLNVCANRALGGRAEAIAQCIRRLLEPESCEPGGLLR